MPNKSSRGQMLIIVVLTMIIALTVGLSLASRTVLNLRLSRQNEESQRAFQAAEAGVEKIIQGGTATTDTLGNGASYATVVSHPSGTGFLLNGGELVDQDTGIDVWLSTYSSDPNLIFSNPVNANVGVWWGTDNQTSCSSGGDPTKVKSAIEIIILTGTKTVPVSRKYFVEANGCSGRIVGTPSTPTNAGGTQSSIHFNNYFAITPTISNGLIMRVIPLFNSSKIYISSDTALPVQGTVVQSTGTAGAAGDIERRVQYFSSYPQIPVEIFPYSLITQ